MKKGEPLYEIVRLAVQVALDAPLKPNRYVAKMGVYVETIADLRAELDKLGIDWRAQHRQSKRQKLRA